MFHRILLPVDNSRYSDLCLELAMSLAKTFGSTIVGFHAYAAQLHQGRFCQLESSLPDKYQQPGIIERQRHLHASLILKGLEIISRSYLESCASRCRQRGIAFESRVAEGKNYAEVVREAANGYDLVVMGARGLGEEDVQPLGSVCLRAVRRLVGADALVVRNNTTCGGGLIMAALDGSFCSRRGFQLSLSLAKAFGAEVEAVATYDPEFHNRIFTNLVRVLSEEDGKLFRLQEQEQIHKEVIDRGMARLCQDHLDWAQGIAEKSGVPFQGQVLRGKAATIIASYARLRRPSLLVAGRFGAHQVEAVDLGSTVEGLLLLSPANFLIVANGIRWSQQAREKLEMVPQGMMRELTRQRVEELARHQGERMVTPKLVETKYTQWAQGSAKAHSEMHWTLEATERIERVPPFIRGMVVKSVESYARLKGATEITSALVEEAKAYWESTGIFHL